MSKIKSFFKDESGQGMTEYALIIALVVIIAAVTMTVFGTTLAAKFTSITSGI